MDMEEQYRWSDSRDIDGYRLPGPENLGRWATAAMLVSILLHVLVFFALDHVKIALGIQSSEVISTGPVNARQVEVIPFEADAVAPLEDTITPPSESAALLEEIDLLDMLPVDQEIDLRPDVLDAEFALSLSNPLAEGSLDVEEMEISSSFALDSTLPEFGRMEEELRPAAVGQITVDPGAIQVDDTEMSRFTDELLKRGNEGLVDRGSLDGVKSLDDLLDLPPNLLLSQKTLLPSDLLFEFNSTELREGAKVGLMKLGLLIDRNPGLYCWIEGHTDLIGGDEFNIRLSKQRAESVKNYLVQSMRMDPDRIITRGFGRTQPLVATGDADEQAPNRRVEIRMRKTPPTDEPVRAAPQPAPVVPQPTPEEPDPPKAILVRPNVTPPAPQEPIPPRATVIPELPPVPRALPVEEELEIPRALPVD